MKNPQTSFIKEYSSKFWEYVYIPPIHFNNYKWVLDTNLPNFHKLNCRYMILQENFDKKTYYQGYLELDKTLTKTEILNQANSSGFYVFPRIGTRESANDFYMKSPNSKSFKKFESYVQRNEIGYVADRSLISEIICAKINRIKKYEIGKKFLDSIEFLPIKTIADANRLIFLCGEPQTGKTTYVLKIMKNYSNFIYEKNKKYNQESHVLIDSIENEDEILEIICKLKDEIKQTGMVVWIVTREILKNSEIICQNLKKRSIFVVSSIQIKNVYNESKILVLNAVKNPFLEYLRKYLAYLSFLKKINGIGIDREINVETENNSFVNHEIKPKKFKIKLKNKLSLENNLNDEELKKMVKILDGEEINLEHFKSKNVEEKKVLETKVTKTNFSVEIFDKIKMNTKKIDKINGNYELNFNFSSEEEVADQIY